MEKGRFYLCKHCGNLVGMIENSGVPIVCCGENMIELIANGTDAAKEKHLPVVTVKENKISVNVGEVTHPSEDNHYITWIYLQTNLGGQRKSLKPHETPNVSFSLIDETPVAVYAYCNTHGLFRTILD